ncbi:hypothetical protein CK203_046833 [Vitis vinifera]|uniref:Uncharacterized protein n=1 Tax=Vitis vinifera TaxID=29760 RepID=A0A438HY87_VITVI|nr:hypothetical protein CK203_046833 [Vitis vinifera]
MPKFLKDLCTVKRRIKLSKKTFLIEQVSAIIENKAMVKYKDPGYYITLSLEDRSIKVPRGVAEDVLVQVEKFYYPMDFCDVGYKTIEKGYLMEHDSGNECLQFMQATNVP